MSRTWSRERSGGSSIAVRGSDTRSARARGVSAEGPVYAPLAASRCFRRRRALVQPHQAINPPRAIASHRATAGHIMVIVSCLLPRELRAWAMTMPRHAVQLAHRNTTRLNELEETPLPGKSAALRRSCTWRCKTVSASHVHTTSNSAQSRPCQQTRRGATSSQIPWA